MDDTMRKEKNVSLPLLVFYVVVYLTIIQGATLILTADLHYTYATFPSVNIIIRGLMIPVGLSVVFVIILVSWLGWWKRILREKIRLANWVWIVPIFIILSIIVVTNYSQLLIVNPMMILLILISVLLIGIGEELMFRGIVLETMRKVDLTTELKAALWTALIFGGAHITNIFSEGGAALLQAFIAIISGLIFYVILRVSGTILVPIILHAGWDFSLYSGKLGIDPESTALSAVSILTIFTIGIIMAVRWRTIWPSVTPESDNH